ncbi:MAG: DNA-binding domain-containing protein [Paludibacteraceae bacterium]
MKKTLNAWLHKNQLTEDPNDYVATVQTKGGVTVADIIDELQKEGMEIKRETALDIVSRFNRKAADMVLSGYNVNTGLVYMRSVIKGVFYDKTWKADSNSVYIAINQGLDLRNAVMETTVEILGVQAEPMAIISLTDSTTGKTDGTLTKGRNAELKGSYLKIIGEKPDCGVLFKNIATQVVTKLAISDIVLNEPSRLLILVPVGLVAGEYELSVTTQFTGGNKLLNQPRTAVLDFPVVIS